VTDNGFTAVVDPFQVGDDLEADLVMVTHDDAGHLDIESLEKCCSESTCVIIPESMDEGSIPCMDVETLPEGEQINVFGINVEAVPMYNDSHERGEGVGYRFEMAGKSVYVAGDTGVIDEARELEGKVDLAFLPVEGVYTMDVEQAIKLAVKIKPMTVIPYHYGEPFFGSNLPDLRSLKAELEDRNIGCVVLEPDQN